MLTRNQLHTPTLDEYNGLRTTLLYPGTNHNAIFRGKNMGTFNRAEFDAFLTAHQVSTGVFEDLYLGDYFVIQDGTYNVEWMIAGFDCSINSGDTAFTAHSLALIPRGPGFLYGTPMNSTNTTAGGYAGSEMHALLNGTVYNNLKNGFGDHILKRRVLLTNSVNTSAVSPGCTSWTGCADGWAWYDSYLTLMTEVQVCGPTVWCGGFNVGEGYEKLPVLNFISPVQYGRGNFWLRGVASSTYFAAVHDDGSADYVAASGTWLYVRPLILVG